MIGRFFKSIQPVFIMIALMWIVFAISTVVPLTYYGIYPRNIHGLIGIVAAPFLHGSYSHLVMNTLGMLTFGTILCLLEGRHALRLMMFMQLIGGTLTWLFARSSIHIGASGLIFGFFGYILFAGIFKHHLKYLLVSILILFSYGSMIFGVLPTNPEISWEGHLFGFIAGVLIARVGSK